MLSCSADKLLSSQIIMGEAISLGFDKLGLVKQELIIFGHVILLIRIMGLDNLAELNIWAFIILWMAEIYW